MLSSGEILINRIAQEKRSLKDGLAWFAKKNIRTTKYSFMGGAIFRTVTSRPTSN
jgi:hypothetical protein